MKKRILFVCTHNASRSQMAEGLVNTFHGDRFDAFSAGTEPREVNAFAVRAMAEIGADISRHRSKGIDAFRGWNFDYLVTLCDQAGESCPYFPGEGKRIHKGFEDPSSAKGTDEEVMSVFRRVRDEIKMWIETDLLSAGN